MVRTFYDVLEVSPSAETEDIEAAYRERLKNTHPDVSDDESATDAVKAVIEAGDVLTDEKERQRYDRLGHETYVAVTDVYDPSETGGESSGSGDQEKTESPTESESADKETTTSVSDTPGYKSARSKGVNGANVNPDGVGWVGNSAEDQPDEVADTGRYVASTGERSVLFLAALVAYPILIFATVYPEFMLPFRVIIGVCTFVLVMYLISVPEVSIPAFGVLGVTVGGVIYFAEVPIPSVLSVGALIVTGTPFMLAVAAQTFRR